MVIEHRESGEKIKIPVGASHITASQTSKDAPRSYELSKEDIDLIETACVAYTDEFVGYDREKATAKQIKTLLNKLGCKPREWL